jgi:thermostable 8-oxoguanine DNA glycosylase
MMANPFLIESVVRDLARSIAEQNVFSPPSSQREVVKQLLLSIFSSRVRWEIASEIVHDLIVLMDDQVRTAGLGLVDAASQPLLREILSRHRYPNRAACMFKRLLENEGRILHDALKIIASDIVPHDARRLLIQNVPGLGPKQSSLLLRNLGRGEHLAVLDRHVLLFMHTLGFIGQIESIADVAGYERIESTFLAYADYRRLPADALDLAVWVVMRTIKKERPGGHRNARIGRSGLNTRSSARGRAGTKAIPAVR